MPRMTLKERLYSKTQKMTDLILDAIPLEGGEKEISTEFFDYKNDFKYELKVSIAKTLIEEDVEPIIEDATIVYDDNGIPHVYDSEGNEIDLNQCDCNHEISGDTEDPETPENPDNPSEPENPDTPLNPIEPEDGI